MTRETAGLQEGEGTGARTLRRLSDAGKLKAKLLHPQGVRR